MPCDEYPVITMGAMRAAAILSTSPSGFFLASAIPLTAAAILASLILSRLVGYGALFFATAPTLILYGFMNWDLLAVALMVLGIWCFVRRKRLASGIALGLGAAAKLMPGLLAPVFALDGGRRSRAASVRLVVAAVVSWAIVNAPMAIGAPGAWWEFFRFNSSRPADFDSVWYMGCQAALGRNCTNTPLINALSLGAFLGISSLLVLAHPKRYPDKPLWTMGFAIMATFFLTSKVYSPQYDLFLLPWFALALPDLRLFMLFEVGDALIFVARYGPLFATPNSFFYGATLLRDAALVGCVVSFLRQPFRSALMSFQDRSGDGRSAVIVIPEAAPSAGAPA